MVFFPSVIEEKEDMCFYYSESLYTNVYTKVRAEYIFYRSIIYYYLLHLQYGLYSHRYEFDFSQFSASKYFGREIFFSLQEFC